MVEHSKCECCKRWEEEMYWKHFTSMHFFHTLPPDFHDHLVLPAKFTAYMKAQLPDKVSLKGPSGALWDIELLKSDELLFVGDGWRDFVKDNGLKENFVLVFKFKRNSSFEALIFDQGSSCENEAAYFVKKCRHTKSGHDDLKKRTAREASSTEVLEHVDDEDVPFVASKKSKKDDEVVGFSGREVSTQAPRTCEEDSPLVVSKKSKKENEAVGNLIRNVSSQAPRTCKEVSALVVSKKSKKADEAVGCLGANVSNQAPRLCEEESPFVVSKKSKKGDEAGRYSRENVSSQALRTHKEDSALLVSKKAKKADEAVGCSGVNVSFQAPTTCEEDPAFLVPKKFRKDDDEAVGCSGGKMSTQGPRTQGEDVASVVSQKCKKNDEVVGCSGGKVNTQTPRTHEEDSPLVAISKESKKGDEAMGCSVGKVNTQVLKKRVLYAVERGRGRSRVSPRQSPVKPKFYSRKKSIRNDTARELGQISETNVITPENIENVPEKDNYDKLESQSQKSLNKNEAAKELSQSSRKEQITLKNSKSSPVADHSHKLKGQSEEQPSENHIPNEPTQISKMVFITTGNGENFKAVDHSPELVPQSEKAQSGNRGAVKRLSQISGREMPDYRESSSEEDLSRKSGGKRDTPEKQVLPRSSKKLVSKRVINGMRVPMEFMSKRRSVTDTEKEDTFQRALQKLTENGFLAVMRPSNVYNRFFLSVPKKWTYKYLLCQNQEVVLRVGEKTWRTTLFTCGDKGAGISTGWKKFALENFLEEFDVLVFNLVSMKGGASVVMDVDIFRVVKDIVPLLPIDS